VQQTAMKTCMWTRESVKTHKPTQVSWQDVVGSRAQQHCVGWLVAATVGFCECACLLLLLTDPEAMDNTQEQGGCDKADGGKEGERQAHTRRCRVGSRRVCRCCSQPSRCAAVALLLTGDEAVDNSKELLEEEQGKAGGGKAGGWCASADTAMCNNEHVASGC
jgi:hypothetical protein